MRCLPNGHRPAGPLDRSGVVAARSGESLRPIECGERKALRAVDSRLSEVARIRTSNRARWQLQLLHMLSDFTHRGHPYILVREHVLNQFF